MNDHDKESGKAETAREKTFAPHESPKQQGDGDPGMNKPNRQDEVPDTAEEAAKRAKEE